MTDFYGYKSIIGIVIDDVENDVDGTTGLYLHRYDGGLICLPLGLDDDEEGLLLLRDDPVGDGMFIFFLNTSFQRLCVELTL